MSYFPESISPKPMNPEIKRQWLEALRSGEYKQGRRYLRREFKGDSLYCCIGVLCELHSKPTGSWKNPDGMIYHYRGWGSHLPIFMNDWAGIENETEAILTKANDNGADFPTIANWIEANL